MLDNPPFSILSEIRRFYISKRIRYFLFAPSLTLNSSNNDDTIVVASANITYENGAIVDTSFVTNMCDGLGVWVAGDIFNAVDDVQKMIKAPKNVYVYPDNVTTPALLNKIAERGICLKIERDSIYKISALDAQIPYKKSIFGNGWLLSDKAAAAVKAAAVKAANPCFVWNLSDREKEIISTLK